MNAWFSRHHPMAIVWVHPFAWREADQKRNPKGWAYRREVDEKLRR